VRRAARGAAPWPFRVGFLLHLLQRPSSRQRVRPRRHTCCSNSQYPVASQEEIPVGSQTLRKVASRGARGPLCGEYSHGPVHGDPEEELDSGPHFPYPGKPASDRESGTASHWVSPRTAPAPGRGWGRSAQRGWGGGAGEGLSGTHLWGGRRCLQRGSSGYHFARGGEDPLPGPLPPSCDIPTVQCTRASLENRVLALSPPGNRREGHSLVRFPT